MKITELSRISGVNAATIRSYRLKGFLHPVKEKNGYYDYTAEDLVSLAYLRNCAQLTHAYSTGNN